MSTAVLSYENLTEMVIRMWQIYTNTVAPLPFIALRESGDGDDPGLGACDRVAARSSELAGCRGSRGRHGIVSCLECSCWRPLTEREEDPH